MAEKAVAFLAQFPYTINIQNGAVPSPVNPSVGQAIIFQNQDNTDYLIEMWTKNNDKHVDISLYVPAHNSITIYGNPEAGNGTGNGKCCYNLIPFTPSVGAALTSAPRPAIGGNVIIIGSGS